LDIGYSYEQVRKMAWDEIPEKLKVDFPDKI
jgi:hypothetical protein